MASLKGVTVSYPSILHFCCYICKSPHTDDISIFIVVVVLFFLFPPFLSVQFFAFFIYLPVRFCNTTGSFFLFCQLAGTAVYNLFNQFHIGTFLHTDSSVLHYTAMKHVEYYRLKYLLVFFLFISFYCKKEYGIFLFCYFFICLLFATNPLLGVVSPRHTGFNFVYICGRESGVRRHNLTCARE